MHRLLACVLLAALGTLSGCEEGDRTRSDAELALERVDVAGDALATTFLDAVTISDDGRLKADVAELEQAEEALKELRLATREMEATVKERRVEIPSELTDRIKDYLRFAEGIVDRAKAELGAADPAAKASPEVRRIDASLADMDEQRTEILEEFGAL